MYLGADQKFEDPEIGCKFSYLWLCPPHPKPFLLANVLCAPWPIAWSLKGTRSGRSGSQWLSKKENAFFATYIFVLKAVYSLGETSSAVKLSCACSLVPNGGLSESTIRDFFGWPADWGWRESDAWSLKCQMHQSNLFRHIFIWVFSILSNSVSFSEDICLSWIKSLNGLIKST